MAYFLVYFDELASPNTFFFPSKISYVLLSPAHIFTSQTARELPWQ